MTEEKLIQDFVNFTCEHLTQVHLCGFTDEFLKKDREFGEQIEKSFGTEELFKAREIAKQKWRTEMLPKLPRGILERYRNPNYGNVKEVEDATT